MTQERIPRGFPRALSFQNKGGMPMASGGSGSLGTLVCQERWEWGPWFILRTRTLMDSVESHQLILRNRKQIWVVWTLAVE